MNLLINVCLVLFVLVATLMVLVILMQRPKSEGLGAAFGGASQTVFGPRGPGNFLSKLTTAAAGIFMITSLVLAIFSSQYVGGSVILTSPPPKPTMAPVPTPSGAEPTAPSTPSAPESTGTVETPPAQSGDPEPTQQEQK